MHPERRAAAFALIALGALLLLGYPYAAGPVVVNPNQPGVPPNCPCMIGAHYSVIYETQIAGAALMLLGLFLIVKKGGMV